MRDEKTVSIENLLIEVSKPDTEVYVIGKTGGQVACVIKNQSIHHIENLVRGLLSIKEGKR